MLFGWIILYHVPHHLLTYQRASPLNRRHLADLLNFLAEAAVDAEYFVGNHSSQRQKLKSLDALLPYFGVPVPLNALIIEAIDFANLFIFMTPSKQGHAIRVPDLQGQQEEEGFEGVGAAVDVGAQENVV